MRLYEIVYIFDPSLGEDVVTQRLEKYHELATGADGAVEAIDHWGNRQLAYPIRKQRTGYYVVAQVTADPENLAEFERLLKLDDELMRFLIVLNQGEPTSGLSLLAERPASSHLGEEDDDDDDDDEDEVDDDEEDEGPDRGPPEFAGGRGRRRRHEGPAVELLNYKDVGTLSRFLTEQGKILPKRTTKVTAPFQRQLGTAVKRARYLALIPYVRDHLA